MSDVKQLWLAGRWLAVVFLLWNLLGVTAFTVQWSVDLEALARTDPYQAQLFAAMPAWAWLAYALAVCAATLGALLLVMRRRGAVLLSAIGVLAVIVQFGYTLFLTDVVAVRGIVRAAGFPLIILLMEVLQLCYARWMARNGLLR